MPKPGMSIERRGKFGGVKLHLDAERCQSLLSSLTSPEPARTKAFSTFGHQAAEMIAALLAQEPDLLSPRSPAQIQAELHEEMSKAQMKLARKKAGGKWDEPPEVPLLLTFPDGKVQLVYKKLFAEWGSWGDYLTDALYPSAAPPHVRAVV